MDKYLAFFIHNKITGYCNINAVKLYCKLLFLKVKISYLCY